MAKEILYSAWRLESISPNSFISKITVYSLGLFGEKNYIIKDSISGYAIYIVRMNEAFIEQVRPTFNQTTGLFTIPSMSLLVHIKASQCRYYTKPIYFQFSRLTDSQTPYTETTPTCSITFKSPRVTINSITWEVFKPFSYEVEKTTESSQKQIETSGQQGSTNSSTESTKGSTGQI